MKFKSLLKISKIEEDELKKEVDIIQRKIDIVDEKINEATKSLKECEDIVNNPSNFLLSMSSLKYIPILQQKLINLNNTKKDILIEFEKANNNFLNKKIERKGFEKLIDKQVEQIKKEKDRKEQIFLDDLNAKEDF